MIAEAGDCSEERPAARCAEERRLAAWLCVTSRDTPVCRSGRGGCEHAGACLQNNDCHCDELPLQTRNSPRGGEPSPARLRHTLARTRVYTLTHPVSTHTHTHTLYLQCCVHLRFNGRKMLLQRKVAVGSTVVSTSDRAVCDFLLFGHCTVSLLIMKRPSVNRSIRDL